MEFLSNKPLLITDTILRDAHQSQAATRMTIEDMLPALEVLDSIGYYSLECWGGATFDACMRFLNEDPWQRLRTLKKGLPHTKLQMLFRGQNILGYKHYADDVVDAFCRKSIENGIDIIRIFDALNDVRNLEQAIKSTKKYGGQVEATLSYTISPIHNEAYFVKLAKELEQMGADAICIAVCDSEALVPTLEAAAAKGIKIILFNTTCNYDGLTFIATDNYEAGRLGGKALGEALGGEGKVCLLGSQETVPSNVARCEGARDYIEENFPNMEVVDIQYCDGDMEKALTISNDWITAIPDLAGIFSNNDFSTIAAANIIEERGRVGEIVHVGFDATETNVVYLESGTTTAIVTQDPSDIGYQSVVSAVKALEGESLPENIGTNIVVVTKDNLNDADIRAILGF